MNGFTYSQCVVIVCVVALWPLVTVEAFVSTLRSCLHIITAVFLMSRRVSISRRLHHTELSRY